MVFAPRTRKVIKESGVAAAALDLADGVKFVAHKVDEVTDPATEPVTNFVNTKIDKIKAKREVKRQVKAAMAAQTAALIQQTVKPAS